MKRKTRKLVTLLTSWVIIAAMITACGGKNPNGKAGDSGKDSPAGNAAEGTAEKIKISYYGYWAGDIVEGNYCEKLIEDALNIELETKKVNHTKKEQVDLMLASGDMPDCGWFTYDPKYMYHEQELTRTIPVPMIQKYAPSYIKTYEKFPILYKQLQSKEDKNQHYFLAGHQAYFAGNQYFFSSVYRKDWLDKFGIKPDTPVEQVVEGVFMSEKGFTLEQHEEILKKFTKEDPDGNGKDDTVGMLGDKGFDFNWAPLLGAFGLASGFIIEDNGKSSYYHSTERYKEFLKYVNKLYKAGYIDREILTLDSQKFWEKAQRSNGGYFGVSANWLGSWAMTRPPLNILENIEGSSVLMTPGIIGPDGKMGTRMYSATPLNQMFYISKNVKDESKLARILMFAEYTGYGKDRLALQYGQEGVDYKMVDGQPVRNEGYKQGGERGIFTYSSTVQDEEVLGWINDKMFIATKKYTLGSDALWNKYLMKPYRLDLLNETQLSDLGTKYGSNLSDIVNQFFAQAISGSVNIDAEWDNYIKKLNAAGYDKMLVEMQKAPLYSDLVKNN